MNKTEFQIDFSQNKSERILLFCVHFPYINGVHFSKNHFIASLEESIDLILAVEGDLIEVFTCNRERIDSGYFVGSGKIQELASVVEQFEIDLVVFNHQLTPTQERNIEQIIKCRVIDRVGLILAIFAQRAKTQEGKIQVELAQLVHLSSRLVRGYGHLKSQKGGIGLKGPGETQLETDRRLISNRISALRRKITTLKKQRNLQRKSRDKSHIPLVVLVGYTNTGKSTLFNKLTKANVLEKNLLFATLDTTVRKAWLSQENSIILIDTVGFIRDLPHELIAAFSATLEEVEHADLILHIVDISHPDYLNQMDNVSKVLSSIDADHIEQLIVYNKIDQLEYCDFDEDYLVNAEKTQSIRISVKENRGINSLKEAIIKKLNHFFIEGFE